MDSAIEVRYAGVVVGRATQVKDWNADGAFIGFAEPLPTGTRIELRGDEIREARVEEAIESSDPAICGMRVSFSRPRLVPVLVPVPVLAVPATAPLRVAPTPASAQQSGGGGGKRRRRR